MTTKLQAADAAVSDAYRHLLISFLREFLEAKKLLFSLDLLELDLGDRLDAVVWNIGVLFCLHSLYHYTTCKEILSASIPARLCRLRVSVVELKKIAAMTVAIGELGSIGIEALYILEKFHETGIFELGTGHGSKITSWEHRRHMAYIPCAYAAQPVPLSAQTQARQLRAAQIDCLHEWSSQFCSSDQVRAVFRGWKLCDSHPPYKQVLDHDSNFWDGTATQQSQVQSIAQAFGLSVTIEDPNPETLQPIMDNRREVEAFMSSFDAGGDDSTNTGSGGSAGREAVNRRERPEHTIHRSSTQITRHPLRSTTASKNALDALEELERLLSFGTTTITAPSVPKSHSLGSLDTSEGFPVTEQETESAVVQRSIRSNREVEDSMSSFRCTSADAPSAMAGAPASSRRKSRRVGTESNAAVQSRRRPIESTTTSHNAMSALEELEQLVSAGAVPTTAATQDLGNQRLNRKRSRATQSCVSKRRKTNENQQYPSLRRPKINPQSTISISESNCEPGDNARTLDPDNNSNPGTNCESGISVVTSEPDTTNANYTAGIAALASLEALIRETMS